MIKPEEGKKLADSWGAAFMESSAKENQVTFIFLKQGTFACFTFYRHNSATHIFLFSVLYGHLCICSLF